MNRLIIPLIIILVAILRLIPHPPNFTPIIAMGLFSGCYVKNRSIALVVPISAMFISDIFLGLHLTIYWVYGSLLLVTILGRVLVRDVNFKNCMISAFSGAVVFFIVTNFGVWFSSSFYPNTFSGILACYTMALPFFSNTLLSSFIYSGIMFGGYELIFANATKVASDSSH